MSTTDATRARAEAEPDAEPAARTAPRLTVGVPVWNGEQFLEATLTALRDQDLRDIEVLIGDNGSTDATAAIAHRFAEQDPRFVYLGSDTNRGIPWNWNRLLARASGRYFMWNSADDVVRPGHLAACADALDAHPEAGIAFSRVVLADADDNLVGDMDDAGLDFLGLRPHERVELFFRRNVWQAIGYGGTFRTEQLRELGGLPAFWGGDCVLAVAMAMRAPWVQVPEQLFVSRRHAAQATNLLVSDPLVQVRAYIPGFRRRFAFPQISLHARAVKAALTAPVPTPARVRGALVVLRAWTVPEWRTLAFDVKRNLARIGRGRS